MTFIPYFDKIQVRPLSVDEDSPIIRDEDNFQEAGIVIATGEGISMRNDPWVKPGDTVYFLSHGCWKTKVGDEDIWIVPFTADYILGKVEADVADLEM